MDDGPEWYFEGEPSCSALVMGDRLSGSVTVLEYIEE